MQIANFVALAVGVLIIAFALAEKNRLKRIRGVFLGTVCLSIGALFLLRHILPGTIYIWVLSGLSLVLFAAYMGIIRIHQREAESTDPEWLAKKRAFPGLLVVGCLLIAASLVGLFLDFLPLKALGISGVLLIGLHVWEKRVLRARP